MKKYVTMHDQVVIILHIAMEQTPHVLTIQMKSLDQVVPFPVFSVVTILVLMLISVLLVLSADVLVL
jgi:hypothetical protein